MDLTGRYSNRLRPLEQILDELGAGRAAQRDDPVSLPDLRHLDPVRPPIEEFDTNDLPAASMSRRRLGPTCSVRSMAAS